MIDKLLEVQRLIRRGDYSAVGQLVDQLLKTAPDSQTRGSLLTAKAEVALYLGDAPLCMLREAVKLLRLTNNNEDYATAKFLLGWALIRTGQPNEAVEYLLESRVYFKRYNRIKDLRRVLAILAQVSYQRLDVQSVEVYTREIASTLHASKDRSKIALYRANLARLYLRIGRFAETRAILSQYQEELENHSQNSRINYCLTYGLLEGFCSCVGDAEKSFAAVHKEVGAFGRERAILHEYLGNVYLLAGRYTHAERELRTAVRVCEDRSIEGDMFSQIKRLFGDLYVATQKWELAEKYAREALAVAEKINERLEIAACYRVFAQVEHQHKNDDKTRDWFKKAIDLFNLIGSRYELAVTRYLAATSGLYHNGERMAMLYLAREYFELEKVQPYMKKVDAAIKASSVDKTKVVSAHTDGDTPKMIVASPAMKKIVEFAEHVAQSQMNILLTGETGSGKDLLARYIHWASGRKGEFVSINCAAIPNERVEAELFGHVKGSYTGAIADRAGLIEQAENGTLYLNEIADATPEFQAKLLEVLETRMVRRLGSNSNRKVAFRLIAATNHDLKQRMRDDLFRQDLYHRLNDIPMTLPPLSQRWEDFEPLVRHFLTEAGMTFNGDAPKIDRLAAILASSEWPGNIRQLRASLRTLYLSSHGDVDRMVTDAAELIATSQRDRLLVALEQTEWNRTRTAEMFGVSEGTIRNWMLRYKIAEPAGVET